MLICSRQMSAATTWLFCGAMRYLCRECAFKNNGCSCLNSGYLPAWDGRHGWGHQGLPGRFEAVQHVMGSASTSQSSRQRVIEAMRLTLRLQRSQIRGKLEFNLEEAKKGPKEICATKRCGTLRV